MLPHVRIPASTSNIGAGFDCVGLAIDLWLDARLIEGGGGPQYGGTLAGLTPGSDLIHRTLLAAGVPASWRLEARSDIPVGKGLGSSGAAVVAALALADLVCGREVQPDAVFARAAEMEGHPDNVGPAVYGGLFLAGRHAGRLTLSPSIGLALAVPDRPVDTRAARARLPRDVPRETAVEQAARAAALILGLTQGAPELIGFGMEDRVAVPYRKDLIAGYDTAVAAGRAAGAYGVTISGSGSAVLAIGPPQAASRIAQAMADALTHAGNPAEPITPAVAQTGMVVVR